MPSKMRFESPTPLGEHMRFEALSGETGATGGRIYPKVGIGSPLALSVIPLRVVTPSRNYVRQPQDPTSHEYLKIDAGLCQDRHEHCLDRGVDLIREGHGDCSLHSSCEAPLPRVQHELFVVQGLLDLRRQGMGCVLGPGLPQRLVCLVRGGQGVAGPVGVAGPYWQQYWGWQWCQGW